MPFRITLKLYVHFLSVLIFLLLFQSTATAQLLANFTMDESSGCSPLTVSFTNTTTGGSANTTWKWDFGNGNTSTLKNPGATYVTAQTYTVTLTATDGANSNVQTKQVIVYKKPVVDFSASPTNGCLPLPVTFTSNSTAGDGTIANYFWDYGDGNTNQGATLQQSSHTYNFAEEATVSLTVTNNYGCYSTTQKSAVQIMPAIHAGFTTDNSVLCSLTDAVTFTDTSTGSGTLSYFWDFGDGTTSTNISPSHTYSAKGIYPVKLTVSNTNGCSQTSNIQTINADDFSASFSTPSLICQSTQQTFTDQSSSGYTNESWQVDGTYTYDYGYGSLNYSFYTAGQHTIQLTDTYGTCSVSVSKQVTVNGVPNIDPFIVNTTSFCNPPVTVNFKDTTPNVTTWAWNFNEDYGGLPTSTIQAPSYTYNSQGGYEVYLTVTNAAGCSASESQYINISTPNVYISTTYAGNNTSCGSITETFVASPASQIATYQWNFGDQSASSSAASPSHTFSTAGSYTVTLNYTTIGGCKGSTTYGPVVVNTKPVANFYASSTNVCGNTPITFTDQSTGEITNWDWNFGSNYTYGNDGYYYDDESPIIQYTDSGTYTVSLIVSNESCSDTLTKTAYIKVNPPFPKISGVYNTCNGTRGLVKFTESSKEALNWTWNFGDGSSQTFTSKQDTVSHTYTKTGAYEVVLTTTNGSCTLSDSIAVYVLLKQSPTLSSTQTEDCENTPLPITINNLEVNPYPYDYTYDEYYSIDQWQYGDGSIFNGSSNTNNYYWQTTYTGTLSGLSPAEQSIRAITYSSYFGCTDTTNYLPIKIKGPVAGFKITTNNVCFKSPVVFQDTSYGTNNVGIKTWTWNFDDGTTETLSTGGTVSHYYSTPGTYYPTLTVTDSDGCSQTTLYNYNAYVQVGGTKAAFYYSPSNVAPNTTIYFDNSSNYGDYYNAQFEWSFGDGTTSTDYYPSHSYPSIGVDTVKLIAENTSPTCIDTAIQVIYVKNVNTAFTYVESYINNNSCPPVLVRFTNTSVNASSVSWNFGDGSTAANQNYPSHTYLNAGVYPVTLYGYGIYGTVDSTVDSITIKGPYAKLSTNLLGGCLAQTITLSALVIDASSITWDFADGTVEQTQDTFAVHSYLTPGLYTPSLIMKDAQGCSSTSSLGDTIVIDTLNVSLINPKHYCDSAVITFDPNILSLARDQMGRPLVYNWDFGTGNPADTSDAPTPSFDYTQPGTYTVKVNVQSAYGCVKDDSANVVIATRSKGILTGPSSICEDSTALFSGNASIINSNITWAWNFGNGVTSTLQNPPIQTFMDSGTYNISFIVSDNGCEDTSFSQLVVHAKPVIGLTPKQPNICLGKSVQLNAHDGTNYTWLPDGVNTNGNASTIVSPSVTTTYTVSVTNSFGCYNNDSTTVTVIQPFKINVPADTTVCQNSSIQLYANGATNYEWINTTIGLSNTKIANPTATLTTPVTYTVVGYDNYNCFADTTSINISVNPIPTVNAGTDIQTLNGTPVQLNATGSSDITQWNWTPPDYLSCANCQSPISTPANEITYTVTGKNQYGCAASDNITISLLCTQQYVYIPSAFTPNGDGKNDIFYIDGKGVRKITSLQIFDRWGYLVFERSNFNIADPSNGWDGTYKGAPVSAGTYVYIAKLECDTGEPFERKGTIVVIR